MNSKIIYIGRHEGLLRDVSRGCAYGDPSSIEQGASILSAFIKCGSIIVPMPSHVGYPTTMKNLCETILQRNCTLEMVDCLRCLPHQSNHIQKLHNESPSPVQMNLTDDGLKLNGDRKIYIIDNCISSGVTASAALAVLPNAVVIAITKS